MTWLNNTSNSSSKINNKLNIDITKIYWDGPSYGYDKSLGEKYNHNVDYITSTNVSAKFSAIATPLRFNKKVVLCGDDFFQLTNSTSVYSKWKYDDDTPYDFILDVSSFNLNNYIYRIRCNFNWKGFNNKLTSDTQIYRKNSGVVNGPGNVNSFRYPGANNYNDSAGLLPCFFNKSFLNVPDIVNSNGTVTIRPNLQIWPATGPTGYSGYPRRDIRKLINYIPTSSLNANTGKYYYSEPHVPASFFMKDDDMHLLETRPVLETSFSFSSYLQTSNAIFSLVNKGKNIEPFGSSSTKSSQASSDYQENSALNFNYSSTSNHCYFDFFIIKEYTYAYPETSGFSSTSGRPILFPNILASESKEKIHLPYLAFFVFQSIGMEKNDSTSSGKDYTASNATTCCFMYTSPNGDVNNVGDLHKLVDPQAISNVEIEITRIPR